MTVTPADELTYLARATDGGDENALEALLRYYHGDLREQVRYMLGQSKYSFLTVEDIVQETLIEVFIGISRFRPDGPRSFLHWMVKIAHNKIKDGVRAATALKRGGGAPDCGVGWTQESMVGLLEQLSSKGDSPSHNLAITEAIAVLQMAIARLKPAYRQAIQHRYIDGLSLADAAQLMERTPKAIERLCDRAMKSLRSSLGAASNVPRKG